ncbi:NAD-dependent deacetylase sirtuin-2 [Coniochaeta ligniaria NRRL 30616]|uniref:NAD-dependent deacetylase sirtuin-2 n=1 Tax=Coniochaeta ligniaria NRRL 30616 TaxID=1408157 RepID=A0A1J7JM16_9PEZI|nr:NAD-dependent deacetylase sirtuin-2 [Coniochaeta ligniaria NRRL 30616]
MLTARPPKKIVPDFRSPNTGLYANLARLNLPYAEAVFDISYFREHPEPFYVLARELYPGKFHPTISHVFIALLAAKGLLFHLFTQNIDCLERRAGVPGDLIVEAHGSFATQRCIECKEAYPDEEMLEHVKAGLVPRCEREGCGGLVKPDIVFFGEQLPDAFRAKQHFPVMADMVLILGTSLTVHPFASLPETVREEAPRVLFNLERVGGIGSRADDVVELGDCDAGIRKLADALGWREELEEEWRRVVGDEEAERQLKVLEVLRLRRLRNQRDQALARERAARQKRKSMSTLAGRWALMRSRLQRKMMQGHHDQSRQSLVMARWMAKIGQRRPTCPRILQARRNWLSRLPMQRMKIRRGR